MVVEAVAEPLARRITEIVPGPPHRIGASAACDGQVLVLEDMLGCRRGCRNRQALRQSRTGIEAAIKDYAREVRSRAFPGPEHVYGVKPKS